MHDGAVRERELAMQAALAEQRAAEAAIEKQRAVHGEHSEALSAVQGRYYEVGADISRLEQRIEHTRELRERQRADLAQTHTTLAELDAHIERDERQLATLRAEIARLAPERVAAQQAESVAAARLETPSRRAATGSSAGRAHRAALSAADQSAQVERARIEQLENQLQRLAAQARAPRRGGASLGAHDSAEQLARADRAGERRRAPRARQCTARARRRRWSRCRRCAPRSLRPRMRSSRRAARARLRGAELTSLEALQAAALSARMRARRRSG